jgi:hypothetical protein
MPCRGKPGVKRGPIELLCSMDTARAALLRKGYDLTNGARPLRRVIQRRVENAISKRVLAADFAEGDTVLVDHGADDLTLQPVSRCSSSRYRSRSAAWPRAAADHRACGR